MGARTQGVGPAGFDAADGESLCPGFRFDGLGEIVAGQGRQTAEMEQAEAGVAFRQRRQFRARSTMIPASCSAAVGQPNWSATTATTCRWRSRRKMVRESNRHAR